MKTHQLSDPRKRRLIEEVNARVIFSAIPKTINSIQEDFINNISNNEFFTEGEKQALALFFESNSKVTSKSTQLFESQIDEGIADWFKSGIAKVKKVFGSIKDYVVKVWTKIKTAFINLIQKGTEWISSTIDKIKSPVKKGFEKALQGPNKDALIDEITNATKIYQWIKSKTSNPSSLISSLDDKVVDGADSKIEQEAEKIEENIFTLEITSHLSNSKILLESEGKSKWLKYIMNAIKIILNPVMGTIGVVGSWAGSKLFTAASKFIEKLGGPKAIDYHVTPEIIMAAMEISGVYEGAWKWVLEFLEKWGKEIPFISELIHFFEFGHKVLVGYAIFEIIKEVGEGITKAIANLSGKKLQESISPEFTRMQQLAGLK